MNYKEYLKLTKQITRREAEKLVAMGNYDTVHEAWSEAEAICEESDAYCELDNLDEE